MLDNKKETHGLSTTKAYRSILKHSINRKELIQLFWYTQIISQGNENYYKYLIISVFNTIYVVLPLVIINFEYFCNTQILTLLQNI